MPRRTIGFILFALVVSLGCLRLGFWQLSRLSDRRARNADIAARVNEPSVDVVALAREAGTIRYRPVHAAGRWDYENELVLAGRARNGAPGVYLLTPLRGSSSDPALLVVRGWVYAPDAKSVRLADWHEGDSASIRGFAEAYVTASRMVTVPGMDRAVRVADSDSLAARMPYPIRGFMVVQTSDGAERADRPARLALPALDDGSHRTYAIQWFLFAAIAWVGVAAVVRAGRSRGLPPSMAGEAR